MGGDHVAGGRRRTFDGLGRFGLRVVDRLGAVAVHVCVGPERAHQRRRQAFDGTAAAREKGLYRMEGKEYVVKDGDVMLFKFNV